MNLKDYQNLCKRTTQDYGSRKEEILMWGLGIAGEAADTASCIKKTYGHDNDQILGIKENLGDTMWYIAMICNFFGWNMEDVCQENIDKLKKRYPQGFNYNDAGRNGTMVDWNEK
ncbi:nucleoside triphosphate pyrophosphohydrolase family protein [Patescibacteria group bacterium]|nr:nucleoside triphosphate pyrophosphohydrolase family protein [Patescibacteria group bacterium]